MKRSVFKILRILGITEITLRRFRNPRIFLYHGVANKKDFLGIANYNRKHIPKSDFEKQIDFLSSRFTIVPLASLMDINATNPKKARGLAAITFDDGYGGIFQNGWKILKDRRIPFTIFLTTGFINKEKPLWVDVLEYAINLSPQKSLSIKQNDKKIVYSLNSQKEKGITYSTIKKYAKSIPEKEKNQFVNEIVKQMGAFSTENLFKNHLYSPLSWEEIREMMASGLVTIGAHTESHAILSQLTESDLRKEIVFAKQEIESNLGASCSLFAYPNGKAGDFSQRDKNELLLAGFQLACATEEKFITPAVDLLALPRVALDATEDWSVFLSAVSGLRFMLRSIFSKIFFWRKRKTNQVEAVGHFDRQAEEYHQCYSTATSQGYSFRARRNQFLALLKEFPARAKVLDLGCGPGVYTRQLAELGFEVFSVDPAPKMIEIAERHFSGNPLLHFKVARAEALPYPDNYFNVVIAAGLIDYFNDASPLLSEVYRVMKPGGKFLVSFPFAFSLVRIWERWIIKNVGKIIRMFKEKEPKIKCKEFSIKFASNLLVKHNFPPEKIVFYNARLLFFPLDRMFPRFSVRISHFFEGFTPRFLKTGFIIQARKILPATGL